MGLNFIKLFLFPFTNKTTYNAPMNLLQVCRTVGTTLLNPPSQNWVNIIFKIT